jgi:hypothetical protein
VKYHSCVVKVRFVYKYYIHSPQGVNRKQIGSSVIKYYLNNMVELTTLRKVYF